MTALLDAAALAERLSQAGDYSQPAAETLRLLASHARESAVQIEALTLDLRGVREEAETAHRYHDAMMTEIQRAVVDAGASIEGGRVLGIIAAIKRLSTELDAWKRMALAVGHREAAAATDDLRKLGIDPATGECIATEVPR